MTREADYHEGLLTSALLTRRRLIRHGVAGGAALSLSGLLAACGSDDDGGSETTSSAGFKPSAGASIPQAEVRFAMWPFADLLMGHIGLEKGYFDEVGIQVQPASGATIQSGQTTARLLNDQIDIVTHYVPTQLQSHVGAPSIKMIMFTDTFVGAAVLAAPDSGAKTVGDFMEEGQSFKEAAESTMAQLKGRTAAISSEGNNRAFFTTVTRLGGITPRDLKLEVLDDPAIVQLGKSGKVEFPMPGGAAQNVELLNVGFYQILSTNDLLQGLPPGDPRAANSVGQAGLAATTEYVDANKETVLRFLSVYFRILNDLIVEPDEAMAILLPFLKTTAGVDVNLEDAKTMFAKLFQLVPFDKQGQFWTDDSDPYYFENVYGPQIEVAKKGGVIPANEDVTPGDLIIGGELYEILLDLKRQYEARKSDAQGLSGSAASLAKKAETQYEQFNYLDAVRLLTAAQAK